MYVSLGGGGGWGGGLNLHLWLGGIYSSLQCFGWWANIGKINEKCITCTVVYKKKEEKKMAWLNLLYLSVFALKYEKNRKLWIKH